LIVVFMVDKSCCFSASFTQGREGKFQSRYCPPPGRMNERVVLLRIRYFPVFLEAFVTDPVAR